MKFSLRYLLVLVSPLIIGGCPIGDDDQIFLSTGLQQMQSSGVTRDYYLRLPADYYFDDILSATALGDDTRRPLIIAFHGYTGSLDNWVGPDRLYDLMDVVGDEAIMVFPNALPTVQVIRAGIPDRTRSFFLT